RARVALPAAPGETPRAVRGSSGYAVPDLVAGAVWAGDDRIDGRGNAGHRVPQRVGSGGHRNWRDRADLRNRGGGGGGGEDDRPAGPDGLPAAGKGAVLGAGGGSKA